MVLGMVARRLSLCLYGLVRDLLLDVELFMKNAARYNPQKHPGHFD
jgi:hypothetical protein